MRIAQVAPLFESVPPKLYGGTERVVAYLTEELVRAGHDVTLFASGDSVTSARLVPVGRQSTRLDPRCRDPLARHVLLLEKVFASIEQFDIVHFHIDYLHFPLSQRHAVPHVTTLHGRLDMPDLPGVYEAFPDVPVVSISATQRTPLPWLNWQATVHHGLPPDLYPPRATSEGYLAFCGRISREKRPDRAIRIAERAGIKLLMAAKVDPNDRQYFADVIRPMLKSPWVEYIGEIGEAEKADLLGGAQALLFPIDWPEPFGLVMLEAMACGTPTIAWRRGSVPEVIDDNVTGYIVDSEAEAVEAVQLCATLDRARCRSQFERRFTSAEMAANYLALYGKLTHRPTIETRKDERVA